jgi:hypothetical protein
VHHREHHVQRRQRRRRRAGATARLVAGHHRQQRAGGVQRDALRVVGMQQVVGFVAQVPQALLVHADQHRLEAAAVQRGHHVARGLQRYLVFGRLAAEDDPDPGLVHP